METREVQQTHGFPQSKKVHLRPGETLNGRYQILRVLGAGGMGAVYEARDLHFPNVVRLCAVKEIALSPAVQPVEATQQLRAFEREVNLLASLSHPSIPKIYDYFSGEHYSYLVLELIRGQNLETFLAQSAEPLPERTVVRWAIGICDVLHYLHTREPEPIVFRDLKPSNVMLNEHGQIVLIDFGIAKVFREEKRGTMIGTEGYSPPEQYRGLASPRGDIYALGATMHHLLSGCDPTQEAPFTFHDRPLRQYNPTVTPQVEAVVMKALAYEPEERFATALEMRLALEGALSGGRPASVEAVGKAREEWEVEPLWVFQCEDEIRSSPRVAGGMVFVGCYDNNLYACDATSGRFLWKFPTEGGIAATPAIWQELVLIGSEDFFLYGINIHSGRQNWKYQTKGRIRSSCRIAFEHAFFGSDDGYVYGVHAGSGRMVWRSPTGGQVRSTPAISEEMLFVGCEDGYLYAMNLQRGIVQWRHHCGGAVTSSPVVWEGLVIVGSCDRHVYALDIKSGWPVWRFRTEKAIISSPCVGQETVYIGSADGCLYAIEASSGRLRWKFETQGQVNSTPALSQDTVYVGSADTHVYAIDARTGRQRWKYPTGGPVISSPSVCDDRVLIGSMDGKLYALPR